VRDYQERVIFVSGLPEDDGRTDSEFEADWKRERDTQDRLLDQVKLLEHLPHPPRALPRGPKGG
jgi:hypothetical protein